MQLSVNIENDTIAQKVLWMLEHFKSDGVQVVKLNNKNEATVLSGFKDGLSELKSVQDGSLQSRPMQDLLDEL